MSAPSSYEMNLFSFKGKTRILHLSWIAFFISFVVWFNHAPLMAMIREDLGLTKQQVTAILILNVALTIPARVIIGMFVDKFGPRVVYSALLFISSFLCFFFALADSFETMALARFLMGFVGAGFVIGIRLISEWYPAKTVGLAEGIYGGWGNFGSAAAALTLPTVAYLFGGDDGWRYAIGSTGLLALVYSFVFYINARDTPQGATYFKPNKAGAMEISSKQDMLLYVIMKAPMFLTLALLAWKLGPQNLKILAPATVLAIYIGLFAVFLYQVYHIFKVNEGHLKQGMDPLQQYKFKQVAILNLAYLVTFGSELAVVSMLPLFFMDTFGLTPLMAGMVASSFAFMNLLARPSGGYFSDKFGRKTSLMVLLVGLAVGYLVMSQITADWAVPVAVLACMCCSFFVQAGEGAVFATVPLIKRRMTGQIAGMVGAYGNIGAVCFLTVFSFVAPQIFFMVIGGSAVIVFLLVAVFMEEPAGEIAEILPDGTIEMIKVG
ncbi:NarK family nitrate/nitrite MFS transporter [Paremcibacter congregatus]|uniref:Nitrate/nitrite transporter n=1 Tax=Paremcibacter congregatus TaxID=2043170 RepID=A0A2G4YS92_9PROT|nr:NarK family nitrate/nitrite MFS transporter [Paremcibacter congregatus]PHZ85130.1 MFS transporter [Paremcibacter congregatus]QDE27933.1 NarK family nitrate/nitrite MFS transporter [Paremcibacter congregatus]